MVFMGRVRYAPFMADLLAYLAAVGRHWKSGTTGGSLAVVLMFASNFHPLPKTYVAAALLGYVLVAGFFAWREEYQQAHDLVVR